MTVQFISTIKIQMGKMLKGLRIIIFLCLALVSCQNNARKTAEALFHYQPRDLTRYNLKKPNAKYFLPYVLEEISGMSYFGKGLIACVQDEEGKVFLFNHKTQKIDRVIRFAKPGDYEGIATVNNLIYVAQSNGDIHNFELTESDQPANLNVYHTILKKDNNVEGIAYDFNQNKLVLACKGDAGVKGKNRKGKAFYLYDLEKMKMVKKPAFTITKSKIKKYLEEHKDFEYEENRINFKPSGIAVHPKNGLYYIIASVGKLLLITNQIGEIKGSIPLDPRLFGQPEGICFAPNGDMFISCEGQGDRGFILKFKATNE
jgi:uncharacterized protein YjiK